MAPNRSDIIQKLRKEILSLQGFKVNTVSSNVVKLGPITNAFPNHSFPLGCVHEFFCARSEVMASTSGFIAGILSFMMKAGGTTLWICKEPVFPQALKSFGIDPEKIIFLYLKRPQEILWAIEEALKCNGFAAVVAELRHLNFIESRRLQIAAAKTHVTCFLIRQPSSVTTASVARWKITPLPSSAADNMPGVGFLQWKVELLRGHAGKTGSWQVQWIDQSFQFIYTANVIVPEQRKAG
jgi:protein ImuA